MSSLFQITLSLALVLVLIFLAFRLLQRVQGRPLSNQSALSIRASIAVGPREKVVLLEAQGHQLLVGVGSGQVRLLAQLPTPKSEPDLPISLYPDPLPEPQISSSWFKQQWNKLHAR